MRNKGPLLAALSGIFYGTLGWFGISIVDQGMSIPTMVFWRFLFAGIIVLLFFPFLFNISWKDELKHLSFSFLARLVVALLFGSISTLTYFLAAKSIGTGLSMAIYFSFPIIVVLLSWFIDKERPSYNLFIAIIGMSIGCLFIANLQGQAYALKGIALAFTSGVTYGLYILWNKKMIPHVGSAFMTGLVCLGNAVIVFFIACIDNSFSVPQNPDLFLFLVAMAIFATVLPGVFLLEAIKFTHANLVSILAVCEPLVTLTIGILILHEATTTMQLIGAALVLASALIASYHRKIELPVT